MMKTSHQAIHLIGELMSVPNRVFPPTSARISEDQRSLTSDFRMKASRFVSALFLVSALGLNLPGQEAATSLANVDYGAIEALMAG